MPRASWLARWRRERSAPAPSPMQPSSPAPAPAAPAESLLSAGLAHQANGRWAEAEAVFERVLELRHDDAAAHLALGRLRLEQGAMEEAADSLQLAVVFDPQSAEAHAELACARARLGEAGAAHEAAQAALALTQSGASVWSACGRAYRTLGEYVRAGQCFESGLALEPHSADFACQLGFVRFLAGEYASARDAYEQALALDSQHVPSLHNMGLLELETGAAQSALERFERAFRLRPSAVTAACVAHALRDLGRLDEACAQYEAALAMDPGCGDASINLAYALLMRGDLEAGWNRYESRFEATGTPARSFGLPEWRGEPLHGRRLLIHAEQGLGDEIMFASCLPDAVAQASGCILECNARLETLFARSFPTIAVHGGLKSDAIDWLDAHPACDYQIAIGSLPRYFRPNPESFGRAPERYLTADSTRVHEWSARLQEDGRPRIGIAWRGGTLRGRQWLRSIPLQQWTGLLSLQQYRFVALQHGDHAPELARMRAQARVELQDLSAVCSDIDDLAGLVCALDLVITVDNTLAHLAGALGKPVWVLLPESPEWRYPRSGERMPWYRSMRLFRRSAKQDIAAFMDAIASALREFRFDTR